MRRVDAMMQIYKKGSSVMTWVFRKLMMVRNNSNRMTTRSRSWIRVSAAGRTPKAIVITLEPFLYICIIASTRRILTTGAETAYSEHLTTEVFHRYLLDVGVNVLVIVAL